MSRRLLENLTPAHWDFNQVRWLQGLDDLTNRPVNNRLIVSANAAIAANGNVQSSGVGVGPMQPKRYAEFTVKARVTFNLNSIGPAYVYVYRTLYPLPIPANGAAPHAGDVVVSGDAFAGGAMTVGVNQSAAFSFLDQGLDVTKRYSYYLAVKAPNANALNLVNASQLVVMERS
jgi:hypothetical protein